MFLHNSNAAHPSAGVCAAQPEPELKPELEPMTPRTAHHALPTANHFVKFAPEDIPYYAGTSNAIGPILQQ